MNPTTLPLGGKAEVRRLLQVAEDFGRQDRYTGKRKTSRYKAALHLELSFDPTGPDAPQAVTMHDFSDVGLSFRYKKNLLDRQTVYLRESSQDRPHPWLKVTVKHCSPGIRGYLIGCVFECRDKP